MRLRYWMMPVVGAVAMSAIMIGQDAISARQANGKGERKTASTLPLTRVVMFSSGVAHYSRSAEIEGDVRVDLTFPEQDINDLIKSMVLQDFSEKGRVSAVTYDSHEPIDRTLKSFAINLNGNPTFAQILIQARGEKVEVVMQQTATGQPGTLTGSIIGIETQQFPAKDNAIDVEVLNLWCAEGVRAVKMNEIQRLRFQNPVIENEFRRALETLALSHDAQKKAVSLHFSGEGKRKVQVGYVTESPIWKTSYRLILDKKEKPYLQGWAVVENTTDEDWNGVEMALVSGRPISFKMDLYNPLFINRPLVEPELFASLRPPTYEGAVQKHKIEQLLGDLKSIVRETRVNRANVDLTLPRPMQDSNIATNGGPGNIDERRLKSLQENWGKMTGREREIALNELSRDLPDRYRSAMQDYFKRLHYDYLSKELGERMDAGRSVPNVATASALGDYFQYVIDQPVNLGRKKSALLPIINKDVDATRVSIYNQFVQAKHPLLGLKFKNSTTLNLSQGPITIFEGSTYAGDTRVLDLQPGEERLVSYAIDLGSEVSAKDNKNNERITKVKAVKGVVFTETLIREQKTYDLSNRSDTDRVLIIEHPNREGQGFKFVGDNKPSEKAADVFRFEVKIPAKKDLSYTVIEERTQAASVRLTNNSDDQIRYFLSLSEASPALKGRLNEAMTMKGKWDDIRRDIARTNERIQTITTDQVRIRQNLREVPKDSEAYTRYLKKFDDQEKEMDNLHAKLKPLQEQDNAARKAFETYLGNITVD